MTAQRVMTRPAFFPLAVATNMALAAIAMTLLSKIVAM